MSTKHKLSDMTGYEPEAVMIVEREEAAAVKMRVEGYEALKAINAELLAALKECQAAIREYRLKIGDRIRLPNDTINHASYALKISDEAIAKAEAN